MDLIVTGGNGYIGSHLLRHADPKNDNITVIDLQEPQTTSGKHFEWVKHNIEDPLVGEVGKYKGFNYQAIVHLAAMTGKQECEYGRAEAHATNVEGTRNVLDLARQLDIPKIIFASTFAVHGTPNAYSATKMNGEWLCDYYANNHQISYSILRFGNIYGPHFYWKNKKTVVPRFIIGAIEDEKMQIEGLGLQKIDLVYIDEIIDAILLAIKYKQFKHTCSIGTGTSTSIKELAGAVLDLAKTKGVTPIIEHIARPTWRTEGPGLFAPPADLLNSAPMGFQSKISLADGLSRTFEWYMAQREQT